MPVEIERPRLAEENPHRWMSERGQKGHPSKLEGGHLHLDLEDIEKQTAEEGSSRHKPEAQDDNEPIFGEEV